MKDLYRAYKLKNEAKIREYRNRPEVKQRHAFLNQTYRKEKKNTDLLKLYGITLIQYQEMHDQQLGVCKICKRPEQAYFKGRLKSLAVDYDHQTGKVRGLLCSTCNLAIGYLQDNPALCIVASKYLSEAA